jgi:predicted  nucleic acid-binding Zn-ribbon protein
MDNAVGAILALTAEVYMLRERLQALESELTQRKVLPAGAVENHADSAEEALRRQEDLNAYTQRVLTELSRDRVPVSTIDPKVRDYMRTYAELKSSGELK